MLTEKPQAAEKPKAADGATRREGAAAAATAASIDDLVAYFRGRATSRCATPRSA